MFAAFRRFFSAITVWFLTVENAGYAVNALSETARSEAENFRDTQALKNSHEYAQTKAQLKLIEAA